MRAPRFFLSDQKEAFAAFKLLSNNFVNESRELSTVPNVGTIDTGTFEEVTGDERTSLHRYNSDQLCDWLFDFDGNGGMWDRFKLFEREGDRERRKVQSQRSVGRP
jgi:hypothetical protein